MKATDILEVLGDMDDELIEESEITGKKRPKKWMTTVGAAACFMIVVCAGIIAFSFFRQTPSESPLESDVSSSSGYMGYSLIQTLERKQVYGEFALSQRPEDELIKIFPGTNRNDVYEDERYLYSFDESGRLIGMMSNSAGTFPDNTSDVQKVNERVSELFELYLPDLDISEYNISIEHFDNPERWSVTAEKSDNNMVISKVEICLYPDCEVNKLTAERTDEDFGTIDRDTALNTALEKIYSILDDIPPAEYSISMSPGKKDGLPYYQVVYRSKGKVIEIKVNADTGEIFEDMTYIE